MKKQMIQLSDHFTYPKLIRFVLPSIAMMIFTSIYGVVDGLFVSNFVGKTPFAAVNLIMPFVMIIGGMGFMLGTGGTALVAKVLGEGDEACANRYFSMIVLSTTLLGIVLSVLGIIFMRPVARLLGATQDMIADCVLYGRIVVGFSVMFMLQNVFQAFLVAAERPNLGLRATIAAGVTNMVLDALFVGVFRWGVAGAAVATGLSQTVGAGIPFVFFLRKNGSKLRLRRAKIEIRPLLGACANGSSELMSNISGSFVSMLYNFQLMRLAGEDGVSAYGVIMYVLFIFVALFIGYSVGVAPIISYHYGAGNTDELKNMLKKSVILMGASGIVMALLPIVLAGPLSNIFVGYDGALCALTKRAMRIYSIHFILTGFSIFASGFFTALNNGAISACISFFRTLIFQAAAVLLLPIVLGVDGVWWAVSVAELCATILSIIFLFVMRRRYNYF